MRTIKTLAMVLAIAFSTLTAHAQIKSTMKSYNFSRAIEEVMNGNDTDALEFLNKEISDHPKNGYAYLYISFINAKAENYEKAMEAINSAIKKLPKKDKETMAGAISTRAFLYKVIGDTIQALADYERALKINPQDASTLEYNAQLLYELERYDEADAKYKKIIELNPANAMGYMGLGRNAFAKGDYPEAIRLYNIVIGMYDDYSNAYSFRAESYMKEGKYLEAIDDLMIALALDSDEKAQLHLLELPKEQLPLVIVKLKAMAVNEPHNWEWPYYQGELYRENDMHKEAVEAFAKAFDIEAHPDFLKSMADSYSEIGEYASALDAISRAEQMQPDDLNLIQKKANILGHSGDIVGAIDEWSRFIEKAPGEFSGYLCRAADESLAGRYDEAIADFDMSIMLGFDIPLVHQGKGVALMKKGETAKAMELFRKVVETDTVPNNFSCAVDALLYLGETAKAEDFLNRIIEQDPLNSGNYYNAACLYSRIGDLDKSLSNLRKAFELGYRQIPYIYIDDDLEALRGTEGFKELIEEYKPAEKTSEPDNSNEPVRLSRVEIPFTPVSGCARVQCTINELPLSFIFDTGASMVSLSMVEANFMLKNGYLKKEDIVGSSQFVDANGAISEGTVVNLRNVDFGGLSLNNVKASIVRNQKAPLLLGQSVLSRLGLIEIDNQNKKLIIITDSKLK